MTYETAHKILSAHQAWRRGLVDAMEYTPAELSEALELAITALQSDPYAPDWSKAPWANYYAIDGDIAGFQHNEKATPQHQKSGETSDSASDIVEFPSDVIEEAIKKQQAALRSYRYKLLNGIGKSETAKAGIDRATARIQELQNML